MMRGNILTPMKRSFLLERVSWNSFILCIIFLIVFPIAGCKTTGRELPGQNFSRARQSSLSQKIEGGGWVSIFLNLNQPRGPEISYEITSVELQANEQKNSLLSDSRIINSKSIGNGQAFIARNSLPANNYAT